MRLTVGSKAFDNAVIDAYNENKNQNQSALVRWESIAGSALMADKFETGGWLGSGATWGGASSGGERLVTGAVPGLTEACI